MSTHGSMRLHQWPDASFALAPVAVLPSAARGSGLAGNGGTAASGPSRGAISATPASPGTIGCACQTGPGRGNAYLATIPLLLAVRLRRRAEGGR